MLMLIEPPGTKRGTSPTSRPQNPLLGLGEIFLTEEFPEIIAFCRLQKLDSFLVGKSNSGDFSERWKQEFSERPSWCDADMTLQQIKRGKARGNRAALYSRSFIQKILYSLGSFVQRHSFLVIFIVALLFGICCYGLQFVRIETDIVKLWVAKGGRLDEELNFLSVVEEKSVIKGSVQRESGLGGGFQVIIQVPREEGQNILNQNDLLEHVALMEEIAKYSVTSGGVNWTLSDICFKPPSPEIDDNSLAKSFAAVVDRIVPCVLITPIDCFWEGSKAIGPHPPVESSTLGFAEYFFPALSGLRTLSWGNIDPEALVKQIADIAPIGNLHSFFYRAGIGKGYLDRWCIDPLDPDCPESSPNHFNFCKLIPRFLEYASRSGFEVPEDPEYMKWREKSSDDFLDFTILLSVLLIDYFLLNFLCKKYARPFANWMRKNVDRWQMFLNKFPTLPDYGKVMDGGCRGFAKEVMSWPEDLIIGGVKKTQGHLSAAEALQSVILVASANDVYLRFKDATKTHLKPGLNLTSWSYGEAEKVITAWQRKFTQSLYDHKLNDELDPVTGKKHRRIHPLASTSIADMLEEFCQFNYTIILVGYLLMLLYAIHSQMKLHNCKLATDSCMGLAFAGVLTVTFASISGLGFATWCGIEFNAATTQIVPFLTLGIGVDNIFLLLHSYHAVTGNMKRNEIGMLMKETGMSVVMTSFNNILSFLAGTVLPIPALRSFCAQSSILLTFNLIAILTIYPAVISIDLRRQKNSRRDVFCCSGDLQGKYSNPKKTVGEPVPSGDDIEEDVKSWTLRAFLHNYYVPFLKNKVFILVICFCMFCGGIIGVYRASYGLELSDVLPENTAPAAFLKARDKYFSFYPMFAVLKGPDIDYPNVQNKIENYRNRIGKSSKYVVKVEDEPSEKYWLALMRSWLKELQIKLDAAIARNKFDLRTGDVINETVERLTLEENIAYRLICSYGSNFNCSGRLGKVRFVDPSGTINADGFYNYLTAWYNLDSMMYHVSQASFVPPPPRWSVEWKTAEIVPPAQPIAYSQIPFYLTGLTDTPAIVGMIKEIRAVCERFAAEGLPNFPSGVAFTFWEQYMHLSSNLMRAIGVIALSVFCVISFILLNPWAAAIIVGILLLMTVELAGFLGVAGIKMNPVSAVTIITAVGIGVEFTAHVVLAFLTSLGTRNDRMGACIDRVFVPVIHGALSTLLGIVMLAFSEFEFVIKYFFVVMSVLIAIGVINGLALLPVLLSLIGPSCEVTPVNGGARLSPPPRAPLRKKRRRDITEAQTHRRNISDDSNTATLGPESVS
ncbi:unnamed protein product [Enterobius vermicularis]|uniref:SSD domain-containing protein n=1 Tax=Enterobius vermicularis TaxID=51028 RepID=A0A0N4V470_ENTVE|nr:unnamed protein product [Enterobius vermicularis]